MGVLLVLSVTDWVTLSKSLSLCVPQFVQLPNKQSVLSQVLFHILRLQPGPFVPLRDDPWPPGNTFLPILYHRAQIQKQASSFFYHLLTCPTKLGYCEGALRLSQHCLQTNAQAQQHPFLGLRPREFHQVTATGVDGAAQEANRGPLEWAYSPSLC